MNLFNMRMALGIAACTLGVGLYSVPARAADDEQDVQPVFSMEIDPVRTLSISDPSLDFSPTAEELLAGWSPTQSTVVTVSSNTDWKVRISSSTAKWSPIGRNKPCGDLKWKKGAGTESALTTTPVAVDQGSSGVIDQDITVNFRVRLINSNTNQYDAPDLYSLTVIFDIGAQSS
jgi:hypothetical protein